MREVVPGRVGRGVWTLALFIVAVCVLAFAAPAFASSSPQPVAASPSAAEAAAPAVASTPVTPTLTAALSKASLVFGDPVTVSGALSPAAAGQEVTVKVGDVVAGTATTDATGAYTLTFTARRSGDVVAGLTADPAVASEPLALAVKPKVAITHGVLAPFLPAKFMVKVAPSAYDGVVVVKVVHHGVTDGSYRARVDNGRAVLQIPLSGVDAFTLEATVQASAGLAARSLQTRVTIPARTLSAGSRGPYVKGMLLALQRLKFRIPGVGTTFSVNARDSVMAFQKAYGLPRTYVFNTACWRKIDGAKVIKPKYSGPATHIEVDKGRQILMVVKGGKASGIICVSTGATNNTPEGSFHIQQKHAFTTSGFGGILVRTMGFVDDFAIHGYAPVPPYPASHGCVREPIWACYWVYDQSFVGEALYVYH
jgi:cell wall hydrolase